MYDSARILVIPSEVQFFVQYCIRGNGLDQATHYNHDNNDFKYKFLPHKSAQLFNLSKVNCHMIVVPLIVPWTIHMTVHLINRMIGPKKVDHAHMFYVVLMV